jgi:flagellar P-ring protein precursor FlgI
MSFFAKDLLPVRIKDIVYIEGVRENMLLGYGLVVGLLNTGDNPRNSPFTQESLVSMLERLGMSTRDRMNQINAKNVAAVMVTAKLPAFARQGSKIDVSVSAVGDCKSLQGGVLLVTPLLGADGQVYAVGQGSIATSGFNVTGASGTSITKNVPTNAIIANGAIVEKEVPFALKNLSKLHLSLKNPDFTTARRVAEAINTLSPAGPALAEATDPNTITVRIPDMYRKNPSELIAKIELLYVTPDQVARVVVDEKNGVIVMGDNVRISTVAISQGNLTIKISESPQVSQPNPFGGGETMAVAQSDVDVTETGNKIVILPAGVTLGELVKALNAFGVPPRELSAILMAIKKAGAIHAEFEII